MLLRWCRTLSSFQGLSCCSAGTVAVLSAGTADETVAEECRVIADYMGCYTFKLPDVSVDGLHRVLHNLPGILKAQVMPSFTGHC